MHPRVFVVTLALPLSFVLSSAAAAPKKPSPTNRQTKSKPIPSTKSKTAPRKTAGATTTPVPKTALPVPRTSGNVDPKLARALRKPRHMTKQQLADVAAKFSITPDPSDVRKPTTLSVRRPYAKPGTYMSFPHATAVRMDAPHDGIATIASGGKFLRVRGTGPAIPSGASWEELSPHLDPLHPGFPDSAEATLDGSYLQLRFIAAANRDYVVSCRVTAVDIASFSGSSQPRYAARVAIAESYSHTIRGLRAQQGRVSFAIPREATKRGVDIQLAAYRSSDSADHSLKSLSEFSVSRCEITPIA